ncbi:MAG: hypothetical protein ACRDRO_26595 [Pseudonocardiaceae bacterium]
MADLLAAVASWRSLVLVFFVFGFAPGFCLRLIVLAYPRGDPRRTELIAELYAVPRIERPLWVAEQLEVALFEGLSHRVRARHVAREGAAADRRGRGIGIIGAIGFLLLAVAYLLGISIMFTIGLLTMAVWIIAIIVRAVRDRRRALTRRRRG